MIQSTKIMLASCPIASSTSTGLIGSASLILRSFWKVLSRGSDSNSSNPWKNVNEQERSKTNQADYITDVPSPGRIPVLIPRNGMVRCQAGHSDGSSENGCYQQYRNVPHHVSPSS